MNLSSLLVNDAFRAVPLSILLILIIVTTICGNCFVILAIIYERKLRTACNFYIVSLAIADLLIGVLIVPLSSVYEIKREWIFGHIPCRIWLAMDILCSTASILNLCAISMDRWRAISRPMRYPQYSTIRRASITIFVVWTLAAAISAPPLFGLGLAKTPNNQCELTSGAGYVVYSACGSFFLPLLVMLYFYRQIYIIATRQRMNIKRGSSVHWSGDSENELNKLGRSLPTFRIYRDRESANSSLCSIDSMAIGPDQQEMFKKTVARRLKRLGAHTKAAKTLGIVVGAFVFCWGPFFTVYLLQGVCKICHIPKDLIKAFFWVGYCNSFINPIIYPCLSRDFRQAFRNILHRHYCKKKKHGYWDRRHNRSLRMIRASRQLRISLQDYPSSVSPPDSPYDLSSSRASSASRSPSFLSSRSASFLSPRDPSGRRISNRSNRSSRSNSRLSAEVDILTVGGGRNRSHSRLFSFRSLSSRGTRSSVYSTDTKTTDLQIDGKQGASRDSLNPDSPTMQDSPKATTPPAPQTPTQSSPKSKKLTKRNRTKSMPDIFDKIEIKLLHRNRKSTKKKEEEKQLQKQAAEAITSTGNRRASVACTSEISRPRRPSLLINDTLIDYDGTGPTSGDRRSIYTIEEGSRRESGSSQGSRSLSRCSLPRQESDATMPMSGQSSPVPKQRSDSLSVTNGLSYLRGMNVGSTGFWRRVDSPGHVCERCKCGSPNPSLQSSSYGLSRLFSTIQNDSHSAETDSSKSTPELVEAGTQTDNDNFS